MKHSRRQCCEHLPLMAGPSCLAVVKSPVQSCLTASPPSSPSPPSLPPSLPALHPSISHRLAQNISPAVSHGEPREGFLTSAEPRRAHLFPREPETAPMDGEQMARSLSKTNSVSLPEWLCADGDAALHRLRLLPLSFALWAAAAF